MTRKLVRGIAPLRFGEGRDCTFAAALAAATKGDYDWIMGCSGAAFVTRIDPERWDPLAAAPHDAATLERGARAVGRRLDEVAPPYDDELRELVFARVVEAIDAEVPPLARGLVGPPEFGLIVGYDSDGPTFLARTFFDHGSEPSRVGWDAFVDAERGTPLFLDPGPPIDERDAAIAGIGAALELGEATDGALGAWLEGLRDETRWSDSRAAGEAAFADHAMRTLLADTRRAATRFLRRLCTTFATLPGTDLLRAAEAYGFVAESAEQSGVGAFDAKTLQRFVDPGQRRAWSKRLARAIEHEHEARGALHAAHVTIAGT